MTSDFALEIARYPKSSSKPPNNAKWCASLLSRSVSDAACCEDDNRMNRTSLKAAKLTSEASAARSFAYYNAIKVTDNHLDFVPPYSSKTFSKRLHVSRTRLQN